MFIFSVSSISTSSDGVNKKKFVFVGLLGVVSLSLIVIGILIAYNVVTRYLSRSSYFSNYLKMLSKKTPKTLILYLPKLNFRRKGPKKSQTVDVQESQCGDMSNVSTDDVTSTEYQELKNRKTQIYENLS